MKGSKYYIIGEKPHAERKITNTTSIILVALLIVDVAIVIWGSALLSLWITSQPNEPLSPVLEGVLAWGITSKILFCLSFIIFTVVNIVSMFMAWTEGYVSND